MLISDVKGGKTVIWKENGSGFKKELKDFTEGSGQGERVERWKIA